MIKFINAKINIGLDITGRRADGYHLLSTFFYPVGKYSGTAANPERFCDMIEITQRAADEGYDYESNGIYYLFEGNKIECPPEKNLVVKAADLMCGRFGADFKSKIGPLTLRLVKNIPDGAGMGGGSSDATHTMLMLNSIVAESGVKPLPERDLLDMAGCLGADCPVFVANSPAYAEGIGEKLESVDEILKDMWIAVVKPDVSISTREAFAGIVPHTPEASLRDLIKLPLGEWKGKIKNDFEESLFPKYPALKEIKEKLYSEGAEYASLTGSGAALYGIFCSHEAALAACNAIDAPFKRALLL